MNKKTNENQKSIRRALLALGGALLVVAVIVIAVIMRNNNLKNANVIDIGNDFDIVADVDDPDDGDIDIDDGDIPLGDNDPFKNLPTIKDYGAVGDGKTDDSAALIKYIKSGCTTLLFPRGKYNLAHVSIDLTGYVSIVGESAENTTLLNININAPYGLSLSNICCDTGTDRTVNCASAAQLKGNIMFNVMPVGAQNVSYFSCIFKNCDYASVAKHNVSNSSNKFMTNIILDCQFYNIGYVAVYHILDIDYGYYSRNSFDKIGSDKILSGELAALKLGDTTNNSTCGLKEGLVSNNSFSNLTSGDDISNTKHSIACNFITVQGTNVTIDNNYFTNLLGYGDDREAVYTKVRYLTISNNTITNGGFGEGYICNKSVKYPDAFATITGNTLIGEYGNGIRNYGAGLIEKNTINIAHGRAAIRCNAAKEDKSNYIKIDGNNITIGTGKPTIQGTVPSDYKNEYIIQVEKVGCPITMTNNVIKCNQGDGKFSSAIRVGSVFTDVTISKNDINSPLNAGLQIVANTAVESNNTNVVVKIQENQLTCKGQPISITFQHSKSIASNRYFYITNNTFNPLSSVKYGVTISTGTGNNDHLIYEGTTAAKTFTSNVVYTNTANVESATKSVNR